MTISIVLWMCLSVTGQNVDLAPVHSLTSPTGSYRAELTFDRTRHVWVFYGGRVSTGRSDEELNRVYEFDGKRWLCPTSSSLPLSRNSHAMAPDPLGRGVIVYGGQHDAGPSVELQDCWLWNGSAWTQLPDGPSARYGHAMVLDTLRNVIVLFGGYQSGAPVNETWTYDGHAWTRQFPQVSPEERFLTSLCYDDSSGVVLVFGGRTISGTFADLWGWNGSDWTLLDNGAASGPPSRFCCRMIYDRSTHSAYLYGGNTYDISNQGCQYGDLWRWHADQWTRLPDLPILPRRAFVMEGNGCGDFLVAGGFSQDHGFENLLSDAWMISFESSLGVWSWKYMR